MCLWLIYEYKSLSPLVLVYFCLHHYILLCNYLFPLHASTEKIQIKLATTCNKNEQQQDAKNNAELKAKWTKKTLKDFESLWKYHYTRPKQVYQGLTRDGCIQGVSRL